MLLKSAVDGLAGFSIRHGRKNALILGSISLTTVVLIDHLTPPEIPTGILYAAPLLMLAPALNSRLTYAVAASTAVIEEFFGEHTGPLYTIVRWMIWTCVYAFLMQDSRETQRLRGGLSQLDMQETLGQQLRIVTDSSVNFTATELRVLKLFLGGLQQKEIAEHTGTTDRAVKATFQRIYNKTQVAQHTPVALLKYALERPELLRLLDEPVRTKATITG